MHIKSNGWGSAKKTKIVEEIMNEANKFSGIFFLFLFQGNKMNNGIAFF